MRKTKTLRILFLSFFFFNTFFSAFTYDWENTEIKKALIRFGLGGLLVLTHGYLVDQLRGLDLEEETPLHNQHSNKQEVIFLPSSSIFPKSSTLKSKAQKNNLPSAKTTVSFKDIAGIDNVLVQVKEVVDFLKNPKKYKRLGAKFPKGILLAGPPGTGKTLIAKAIASESGANFFYASASSFVELYVGAGAKKIRELFASANKNQPAIIFIDEIDAIGAVGRGAGANEEYRQTLNELLCQMDGFKENNSILVIGATNNAYALDKALKRPGRFTRIIHISNPDQKARIEILMHYIKKLPKVSIEQAEIENLATNSVGFSPAELENLVNEAAMLAVRENSASVTKEHFVDAFEVVKQRNNI